MAWIQDVHKSDLLPALRTDDQTVPSAAPGLPISTAAQNIPGINQVPPHHAPSSSRKFLYLAEIKQNFCADLLGLNQERPRLSFQRNQTVASSAQDLVQLNISPKNFLTDTLWASVCASCGFPLWLLWEFSSNAPLSSSGSRIICWNV